MSVDYAWFGVDGAGNVRLQARCNTSGTVTLTLSDGRVLTAEADTAVVDGHARFEFAVSTRITGTIEQGSTDYSYTMEFKPLPTGRLKIAHVSCNSNYRMASHAFDLIDSRRPDLLIHLGNLVYSDTNFGTINGETMVQGKTVVLRNQTPEHWRTHYRAIRKYAAFKQLLARTPMWFMWDEHEIIDGYCHGINAANKHYIAEGAPSVEQCTTQAECDAIYTKAREAFDEQAWTNPRNTDAGIDADALYFRVRIGSLCEIIVPDIITYRDINSSLNGGSYVEEHPVYADDAPEKTYLGATQKAWAKASMTAADGAVAHIIWASTKQPYQHNADAYNNSDTWTDCTVERDEIIDHIAALDTSVVWLSHDSHQPALYRNPDKKLLALNACALSSDLHQQGVGYNTNVAWKAWGYAGDPTALPAEATRWVYGWIDIDAEAQSHSLYDAVYGHQVIGPYPVARGADPTQHERARIG